MSKPTFTKEYNEIKHVIMDYYAEGNKQGESQIIRKAFNEQATMYSVDASGQMVGGPVEKSLYPAVDSMKPSENPQVVIAYINITENVAQARVDSDDVDGMGFTDYFNLVKVNGQWQIINKIFYSQY